MSALQEEIKQAMAEVTAPLYERLANLEMMLRQQSDNENPLIPLEEAAKMLGMHKDTLRRKCHAGEFKYKRPGKKFLLYRSELITNCPTK
ncbi:excisionase family DNA-binding protein [Thalassospira tepidiphila]|uniref:Helix-turn-helix domain-containing protein n=2 Tax=Thalassospira tepidiphila TaxID=393657 RepID=A0A853KV15_9PROT|nr:excisionase family DNA-binding protein [Thalassospira tepidiphila]NJB74577.1 excisionase family DNA binding protein [Thalassospira tepidiphila]OAZ08087.1 hypothetical protein TH4_18750 [Thalassospira tepidiphila MCCC 1A03514]